MQKIIDSLDLKIYCSEINEPWELNKISENLARMPGFISDNIRKYSHWRDIQLRLEGKLLLEKILSDLGLYPRLSLGDIAFTGNDRPFLAGNFDFNISHSGNMVVCAGGLNMKIGIDTEQIVPGDMDYPFEFFTIEEIHQIKNNAKSNEEFYRLWVRKEALSKAIGDGVLHPYDKIDSRYDTLIVNEFNFRLMDVDIKAGYKTAMAISKVEG